MISDRRIVGVFIVVFWTLTPVPLLKSGTVRVATVESGDASPSGASSPCGVVLLRASGAGQWHSTKGHADQDSEV